MIKDQIAVPTLVVLRVDFTLAMSFTVASISSNPIASSLQDNSVEEVQKRMATQTWSMTTSSIF
jgi:hypothetical protein